MNIIEGETQVAQSFFAKNILRERLLHGGQGLIEGRQHDLAHHLVGHPRVFQLLRTRINARQTPQTLEIIGPQRIHFRMHDIESPVENLRLAEEQEIFPRTQFLIRPLDTLEKDEFHLPRTICHQDRHPFDDIVFDRLTLFLDHLSLVRTPQLAPHHPAPELHIRHIRHNRGNGRDAAAVHITERIIAQQVRGAFDAQFRPQQLSPLGPHSRQILYVYLLSVHICKVTYIFQMACPVPIF